MAAVDLKKSYDVIVIGGGPGGSTVGTFVASQGHSVLLLERQKFPRHQIGESLLPATVHGICPLLGIPAEELEKAGFVRKRGGTFKWGVDKDPWTFDFSTVSSRMGYAYQVERNRFDDMLLTNAQRKGVQVLQEARVTAVDIGPGTDPKVHLVDPDGQSHELSARFVVDAAGHESKFCSLVGERRFSKFFQNYALYGYYENAARFPGPNWGNLLCATFKDGWFWYIPLSRTLTSVGAVVSSEAAELIKSGHEQAFNAYVEACPPIRDMLAPGKRVTEGPYGRFRVRKDYSYCNTRFYSNRLVLVGDTACFIDPVFSSGVHLSTYAALQAARSINTSLKDPSLTDACFEEYERRYRREYGNFYQFLVAFYDMYKDKESYFWEARKVLNTEESANDAFVRLVAGLADRHDPAFSPQGYLHESERIGTWVDQINSERVRTKTNAAGMPSNMEAERFMQGLLTEAANLQLQAQMGTRRPPEDPVIPGGLLPSRDGLHWVASAGRAD